MDVVATVLLAVLIKKSVDLYVMVAYEGDLRGAGKQVVAWAVGVGGTLLVASSELAVSVPAGMELTLADVGIASQVLVGLAYASGGSVIHDFYEVQRTKVLIPFLPEDHEE